MKLSAEQIAELKKKHGDLHRIVVGDYEFIAKTPSRAAYQRFRDSGGSRISASENLIADSVVHPEAEVREKIFDEFPGFIETIAGELLDICGALQKARVEKL